MMQSSFRPLSSARKGNIKMNKFPPIKASTHNNDYTLLECIDIPEKVGVYWKSSRAGVA